MLAFILIAAHHDTPGCLTAVAFIKTAKCQFCTSKYLLTPELMPHLSLLGFHKPSKDAKSEHPPNRILRVISVKPWNPQKHWSLLEKHVKRPKSNKPNPKKNPILIPGVEKTDHWLQSCLQMSLIPMSVYSLYGLEQVFCSAVPE